MMYIRAGRASSIAMCCAIFLMAVLPAFSIAADRPQWGQRHSRNMISEEKGLPEWFEPGERDPGTGEIDPATSTGAGAAVVSRACTASSTARRLSRVKCSPNPAGSRTSRVGRSPWRP